MDLVCVNKLSGKIIAMRLKLTIGKKRFAKLGPIKHVPMNHILPFQKEKST